MVYEAVSEQAENGNKNNDGKSRVIPRVVKTMVLTNVPYSLWENKEKIPELLKKYADFEVNDMKAIRVDDCFVGKVAISVNKFTLVPKFQISVPAFQSDGSTVPDVCDQIKVTCSGFDKETPKEARPVRQCRICNSSGHWASRCPRKIDFTCDFCGSNTSS